MLTNLQKEKTSFIVASTINRRQVEISSKPAKENFARLGSNVGI